MQTATPPTPSDNLTALPALDPLVEAKDLTVQYAKRTVLEGVSFSLAKGELAYVIGRTGAGKSTLFRTLYADIKPTQGTLRVERYALNTIKENEIPFLRRKLGIVFQDFQLLPDRNVSDNILFAMHATGWKDKVKMNQRLTDVMMLVGLTSRANSLPHQLSGGEQQRTAVARALVNNPVLLIADEPTGNLDPEVTEHIMEILLRINRQGTAVLMATHNYALIERMPGRVLEIKESKLTDRPRV